MSVFYGFLFEEKVNGIASGDISERLRTYDRVPTKTVIKKAGIMFEKIQYIGENISFITAYVGMADINGGRIVFSL